MIDWRVLLKNIIEIENLTYKYFTRDDNALTDINIEIKPYKRTVILGSSGSGKSTLFRLINNTLKSKVGSIKFNGFDINKASKTQINLLRRDIGMVYQHFNLIESNTVIKNVLNGRLGYSSFLAGIIGYFTSNDYAIAYDALKKVGLIELANQKVCNLSGGQKQRVAIARALAQKPKVILADEPVSSLDPKLVIEIMDLLRDICFEENISLVMSLHYLSLAKLYAEKVIGIKDGRIVLNKEMRELDDKDLIDIYGETKEWRLYGELGF